MGCGASSKKYDAGEEQEDQVKMAMKRSIKDTAAEGGKESDMEEKLPSDSEAVQPQWSADSKQTLETSCTDASLTSTCSFTSILQRKDSKASTVSLAVEVSANAGQALLSLCEEIPFIAPVAVLLGAVVKCTSMVKTLRSDAQKFATLLGSVESLLEEAAVEGTLPDMKPAVERLQAVLEESLAHCQKLTQSYWAIAAVLGPKDLNRFKNLQRDITDVCMIISTAASTSAARLLAMQFEESEALSTKVAELGGPQAIANNPEKVAEIEGLMSAGDAVVLAAVRRVDEQALSMRAMLHEQLEVQEQEAKLQASVMSAQIDNLTTMLQAVLAQKGGEVTQESVKDVVDRMPVPADESARLKVLQDLGLMGNEVSDAVGDPELEAILRECMSEFELDMVDLKVCDIDRFTSLVSIVKMLDSTEGRLDGMRTARMCTSCQHTVARSQGHTVSNSSEKQSIEGFGEIQAEEYTIKTMIPYIETLAAAGQQAVGEMGALLGQVMEGKEVCVQSNGVQFPAAIFGRFFQIVQANGMCFKSTAVRAHGQPIAVLCLNGRAGLLPVPCAEIEAKYGVRLAKRLLARAEPAAKQWSCEDVGVWLARLGLQQYVDTFAENAVDGSALLDDIGEQELLGDLGVKGLHAKKLLREINKLRTRGS